MKEYERKSIFFLFENKKKETLGLLNNRRNKYIKQRNHRSIFIVFLNYYKRKGGYWIIYQSESDRPYNLFYISSM